jgi:SNF2 family DNA or RNA helicase
MLAQSLSAFKGDPSVKVLLISLKAGGMALNLTVASRIFLMGKLQTKFVQFN